MPPDAAASRVTVSNRVLPMPSTPRPTVPAPPLLVARPTQTTPVIAVAAHPAPPSRCGCAPPREAPRAPPPPSRFRRGLPANGLPHLAKTHPPLGGREWPHAREDRLPVSNLD